MNWLLFNWYNRCGTRSSPVFRADLSTKRLCQEGDGGLSLHGGAAAEWWGSNGALSLVADLCASGVPGLLFFMSDLVWFGSVPSLSLPLSA